MEMLGVTAFDLGRSDVEEGSIELFGTLLVLPPEKVRSVDKDLEHCLVL